MKSYSRKDVQAMTKKDLVELFLTMQEVAEKADARAARMEIQIEDLNKNIGLLLERVNLMTSQKYGRSSEKMNYGEDANQMTIFSYLDDCFNEAEGTVENKKIEEPEMIEVQGHQKKKAKGKRKEDLSNIQHDEPVISEISHEELVDLLGEDYRRLPDEVYERLEFHPGSFVVKEYHVAVYCSADGERFTRAERPSTDLLRNSIATPSLVAAILNYKYVNALPIYRLEQEFARADVHISRQVMCNWVIRVAERYLSLVYERMKTYLLAQSVIQADETTVEIRRDGRKAGSKSYMWVYSTSELDPDKNRIILYDYQKTRSTEHLRNFLEGYKGTLVCDGYQAYHTFEKETEGLKIAGCFAHARRRFANAVKAMECGRKTDEEIKNSLAYEALQQIAAIYSIDESLKSLSASQRLKRRILSVKPLVEAFFEWLRKNQDKVPPKSETGKGIQYCLNQEIYLKRFLTDGNVPIDNSSSERSIRPFCIGRKNWMAIDTIAGAQASAIAYSIAETAKANQLKPYAYFEHLLLEIPKNMDETDMAVFDQFLPWSENLPEHIRKTSVK